MNNQSSLSKMLTEPVGPLILKNAVPTIITMMITAIYNTADTFFVSRLGTSASGAVGVTFSLMFLMQAMAFTIGMGSGSITSRALGAEDFQKANTTCTTAIVTAFGVGVLFTIFGNIFRESLVRHLGSTPTILPYAIDYARYILFGAPFIVFKLGISGAAIATLISQIVSFSILLSMFIRKSPWPSFPPGTFPAQAGLTMKSSQQGFPHFSDRAWERFPAFL